MTLHPTTPNRAAEATHTVPSIPLDRSTELALRAIADAAKECPPAGPVVLDTQYLAMIARVEALPCNRTGSDKTWLHVLNDSDIAHFRACRLLP